MFRMMQRLIPIAVIVFTSFIPSTAYSKDSVMGNTTTLCFGRFLIDLPAGLHIKEMGQQSGFIYGDVHSEPYAGGIDGFMKKMKQRETDAYQGHKPDGYKFLEMKLTAVPNTRIFIFNVDVFGENLYRVEAYHWDNGYIYSLQENSYEEKKIVDIVKGFENRLIAKLRHRAQDEIPSEPGFCIKNGFIADDGSSKQFEEARMQFNFIEFPDVWVTFYSLTVHKAGAESLLERLAKYPDTPLEIALVKTFRKGKHEVNGFKGEEILQLIPTAEGIKHHVFNWEAGGQLENVFSPMLALEFETATEPPKGERPPPSLTNDQAIKLYDSIVNTIRLRPTKDAPRTSQEAPPKTPLGELAATGRTCPQTGWWKSNDPEAGSAGRQHFNAGEVLPKVALDFKPGRWQAFKRQPVPQQISTVWKLVEYDQVAPPLAQQNRAQDTDAVDKPTPPAGG